MKQIILIVVVTFMNQTVQAQTFEEWFRQKRTQRKYLVQQIAALKVYAGYLKEGYDVAKKGLAIVSDIKDGNFSDHSTYFESLRLVNFSVGTSRKVANIIAYQNQIINEFRRLHSESENSEMLSSEEIKYVNNVYSKLMTECESSIEQLTHAITDNTLKMKDDERLAVIDVVYDDMKDRYTFTRSFINSTRLLISQRSHEKYDTRKSNQLNRIDL